jgi:conjugative transposon TraK protein
VRNCWAANRAAGKRVGSRNVRGNQKMIAMFKKFKSIEVKFQKVRRLSVLFVSLSTVITAWAIYNGTRAAEKARTTIYVLWNGKAFEAIAGDRKENLPVELKDHLRTFHRYFFDLDPDEKAIRASVTQSFYLADGSAKALYDDQVEKGFISGLISGNISERVVLDSIRMSLDAEPYAFRCSGIQTLTRATTQTTRTIVTQGYVRSVERTDNNPHGFLIERYEVVENKDLKTINR